MICPLVVKEVRGLSRRWTTYAGRLFFVGLSGLVLYQFSNSTLRNAAFVSASEFATLGRELYDSFALFQILFVALAAVAAASDAIAREARNGTLGLVLLTPLRPSRIVLGKWKAVMAQAASLGLCGLPFLAVCVYLGGVSWKHLAFAFLETMIYAALAGAVALRASASSPSGVRALFAAAGLLGLHAFLPLLLAATGTSGGLYLAGALHPVFAAVSLARPATPALLLSWLVSTGVTVALTAACLKDAARRLTRRVQHVSRPAVADHDFTTAKSYYGRERRKGRRLVIEAGVWQRWPMIWKDLATRAAARMDRDARVGLVALFIMFFLLAGLLTGGSIIGMMAAPAAAALLLALINGAGLFVHETEGRKLDVLLSTPLTPARIVRDKLLAGLLSPESLIVLGLGGLTLMGAAVPAGPLGGLIIVGTTALALGFAFVLAAAASLGARTLRGAFLFSLGVVCLIYFGLPELASMLRTGRGEDALQAAALVGSPPTLLLRLDLGGFGRAPSGRGVESLVRPFLHQVLLYGTVIAVLVGWMILRIRRMPARLS